MPSAGRSGFRSCVAVAEQQAAGQKCRGGPGREDAGTCQGLMGRLFRPLVAWMASPAVIGAICWMCRARPEPPRTAATIGNR